jgi:hypothetical protein
MQPPTETMSCHKFSPTITTTLLRLTIADVTQFGHELGLAAYHALNLCRHDRTATVVEFNK